MNGVTLITRCFKTGNQLSQLETEVSRKISGVRKNVRIHGERVISCLRMLFNILRGPVLM